MSEYRIFDTQQFQDDFQRDLGQRHERLAKKLREFVYPQLREQPYFGKNIKKLRGYEPETWRYRIGPFRFFYEVDEKKRIVFTIAAQTRQRSY